MAKNMKTMDGNAAAAYASYAFTEVAGIYPITPSSPMAECTDEWSVSGKTNIFGQTVKVVEMQSEAGAAGVVHGSLSAGALTTSYTASQGLLLMIPNMYKIAGELLPCVLHVSARALATHALSIFGDHSDVMACRQTGFAFLASANVQDVMNLAAVAHLSAIKGRVPFLHFFDGFRTSHETQKIETLDYEDLKKLVDMDAIDEFKKRALNPEHPVLRGTAQNPDIFFQAREAGNPYYNALPEIVENYMEEINKLTGKDYKLFNYYGAEDADRVIISMGSSCDCIEETIDYLLERGEKVGLVNVRLYRPFSIKHFLKAIPATAKSITVLDRTKEPGALGEPLYQDVCTAFFEDNQRLNILCGRYGLGSKDVTPVQIIAVFDNMKSDTPKNHFTVGINDDVTHLSLEVGKEIDVTSQSTISCKLWGLGADGTVGANKNSIKIIGDHTDMYAQAYFSYDSKKSGSVTQSHLRFGKEPIRSTYLVKTANFVACHNPTYIHKYDMLSDLKDGGTFLLNCSWNEEELDTNLPAEMKKYLAEHDIKFYTIDATSIAKEIGLGSRINSILQSAFFKLANIIPIEEAVGYMKQAIVDTYGRKGEKIVNMNYTAIDRGVTDVKSVVIKDSWKNATDAKQEAAATTQDVSDFIKNIVEPINALKGDFLPVSVFKGREDGTWEQGTTIVEKRAIAVDVPAWCSESCIQCNQCSYVCPHAAIRPFLVTKEEQNNAPESFITAQAKGKGFEDYSYRIQVDPIDCTGCANCEQVCPSKQKALKMESVESQMFEMENWNYALKLSEKINPANKETVKGSQFERPLLEFSGACTGCTQTPYAKLITQLFGDRMYIANATGCSSIWGGSAPSTPYTKNSKGQGPAWANSLFEDNAEFGMGMFLAVKQIREGIALNAERLIELTSNDAVKEALTNWLNTVTDGKKSPDASNKLVEVLRAYTCDGEENELKTEILKKSDFLVKKSQWIFGGDGWAYDIGFGGLDHVIASGEDVNIFVFDTEVYSNTGGQASKSTPVGAVAKFAAAGSRTRKKDLGLIAMGYGSVYVAQVAMGSDYNQLIKAIVEAEAYPGPSVIIGYTPCIAHGINMGKTQLEAKRAVEAGYWHLYRYNPLLEEQGKNPFILDSKEPKGDYKQFIGSEGRYNILKNAFPDEAELLFDQAANDAARRLKTYKRLADQ